MVVLVGLGRLVVRGVVVGRGTGKGGGLTGDTSPMEAL
jgi:hypothetical protein